jgi:hypothetical protein
MVLMPKPRNHRGDFEAQITKPELLVLRPKLGNPSPPWFWGSTKKPTADFEAKPEETVPTSFEAKLEKTVATGFEAKPAKTIAVGFESKPLPPVLRPNRWKLSEWFWGQTTHKPSTLVLWLNQEICAPRLHVHGAIRTRRHPTSRPPGHRIPNMCDHPRSSAPSLLFLPWSSSLHAMLHLPPTHHETSKHNSPKETKIKGKQNKTKLS